MTGKRIPAKAPCLFPVAQEEIMLIWCLPHSRMTHPSLCFLSYEPVEVKRQEWVKIKGDQAVFMPEGFMEFNNDSRIHKMKTCFNWNDLVSSSYTCL